jgi:putative aldouronate transport system substrate-binding protein
MPGIWTPINNEAIVGVISAYAPQHTTEGSPLVLDYVPLPPLEGSYVPIRPVTATGNTFITTDCKDLEGAMRFLLAVNDVEIHRANQFGEEGVDWEPVIDETGVERVRVINDVFNKPNNKTWCWATPAIGFPEETNPYREYVPPVDYDALDDAGKIEYWRNSMLDMMVEANFPDIANNPDPLFFTAIYTAEEIEENGTLLADIKTYMKQQRGLFITGQLDIDDDAVWQNYVDTLEEQGLSTVLKNAQTAWERQNG